MSRDLKPFVDEPVCCPCPEHGAPQWMADTNDWLADNDNVEDRVAAFRHEGHAVLPRVQILRKTERNGRPTMNCHSRILGMAVMASTVLLTVPLLAVTCADRDFYRAIESGATAQLTVKVVDDVGRPVGGVKIEACFEAAFSASGEEKSLTTDTNGIAVVSGRTGKSVSLRATKDGFYGSSEKIDYVALGQGVRGGEWQPWGMIKQITLLPVKNPQAKVAAFPKWRTSTELNKWIGFDLMKYDFVKPYGSGNDSDMEIMFDWDGAWRQKEYKGMAMKIRFRDNFSGGYYADKTPGSEYEGIYQANASGDYEREFIFSERVGGRNKEGYATSYERHLFDSSKVLVVRSRCKLHEDGTLKSAHYFQLGNIMFSGGNDGKGALRFLSIYNSTPNDTNLEPKR